MQVSNLLITLYLETTELEHEINILNYTLDQRIELYKNDINKTLFKYAFQEIESLKGALKAYTNKIVELEKDLKIKEL